MLFHYNLQSIIVFIYWGVEYNSYNTITWDMTKYMHSHLSAALSRESCIYFSHIPRKRVITIKYIEDLDKYKTLTMSKTNKSIQLSNKLLYLSSQLCNKSPCI